MNMRFIVILLFLCSLAQPLKSLGNQAQPNGCNIIREELKRAICGKKTTPLLFLTITCCSIVLAASYSTNFQDWVGKDKIRPLIYAPFGISVVSAGLYLYALRR